MWCATCQQDVSSPPLAGAEPARCGKCGQQLATNEQAHRPAAVSPTKPRLADDWELEADLRGVERLLGTLKASGFTTGKTLWAHVTKGKSRRTLKVGTLSGACGGLKTRKRLLPRNAALGLHTIQFDTFRRYDPKQAVRYRYTVDVRRG